MAIKCADCGFVACKNCVFFCCLLAIVVICTESVSVCVSDIAEKVLMNYNGMWTKEFRGEFVLQEWDYISWNELKWDEMR